MPGGADHRRAMLRHARRRAWQRYGLALAQPDLHELASAIERKRTPRLLWRQDDGRVVYRLRWRKRWLIVVYDTEHAAIVSFLPWKARYNDESAEHRR
jgi:hypothetical protein